MIFLGYIIFFFGMVADIACTAILVNLVPEAYYLPTDALCAVFVTGIFTIGINTSLSALLEDDLYDDWLFVPIIRWITSYFPVIGAIAFGIQEGKIFGEEYISENTAEFSVFAVIAFVLCTAIFAGHFFLGKKICGAIYAHKECHYGRLSGELNKKPIVYTGSSGSSSDSGDTRTALEKQRDKELEDFNNIVENQ